MARPDTRLISFTYLPVASMWVVMLHNLFLFSDPPLTCHPPPYWLRLFSSQTFSRINTSTFSNLAILHTYLPIKMEKTECSEMSAHKIQMPGNYPEESIQHSEHGRKFEIKNNINLYTYHKYLLASEHTEYILTTKSLVQTHNSNFRYY
jgi:hypothetical protein